MMTSDKRYALITGGGSGIGAAAAKHFAAEGTVVAVVGRRAALLEETVRIIQGEGGNAISIPADLAERSAPERIIEVIGKEWGCLDILVNNAAYIKHYPIDQVSIEEFEMHLAVNVRAPYFLIKAALPLLSKSKSASVINISSSSASLAILPICLRSYFFP